MAKSFIDWTDFSTSPEAVELLSNSIRKGMDFDSYGGKTVFKAIMLSPCVQITDTEAKSYGAAFKQEVTSVGRKFKFKARIVEKNSPHSFIPNPCDLSTNDVGHKLKKENKMPGTTFNTDVEPLEINPQSLVALHTDVFMMQDGHIQPPSMGDIIEIQLKKNDFSYDLNTARFIKVIARNAAEISLLNEHGCQMLSKGFDTLPVHSDKSAAGGPRDDPTFTKCQPSIYPSLPKTPTKFIKYSEAEVIKAIKATGQSNEIQKVMFAIISHEQPNYKFPANNVAGIQLDNRQAFAGAEQSDFDYQTCFRDNGGDQRIFAGFNSLKRGMQAFGKIIQKKMKKFKPLPGNSELADADNMTWNYYRSWNTAFTAEELAKLKRDNQVTRGQQVFTRDWNKTTKVFTRAFTKWKNA